MLLHHWCFSSGAHEWKKSLVIFDGTVPFFQLEENLTEKIGKQDRGRERWFTSSGSWLPSKINSSKRAPGLILLAFQYISIKIVSIFSSSIHLCRKNERRIQKTVSHFILPSLNFIPKEIKKRKRNIFFLLKKKKKKDFFFTLSPSFKRKATSCEIMKDIWRKCCWVIFKTQQKWNKTYSSSLWSSFIFRQHLTAKLSRESRPRWKISLRLCHRALDERSLGPCAYDWSPVFPIYR